MKLYGDFTQEDWLNSLGINIENIPSSFIIHGEWEHKDNINFWKEVLKNDILIPKWNAVIGTLSNTAIGFANVYGGPMASNIVHQFGMAGTDRFIQTGYFGGLSSKINYGDILIVTEAEMQDGVSQWYLPNQTIVKSDSSLVKEAINFCELKGYSYSVGSVLSTSAMLLENEEIIAGWAEDGHLGVDMETATTLGISSKFNKKSIGLLNLSDHLFKGETLYNYTEDREVLEEKTDEKIRELALYLSTIKLN